ncbi:MAG: SWIM zinc finger family protein [Nitrosopumilus sp.]|nr:SWIM zinc finger family protein [Nitrosopumilus sp.]MDH3490191.1 SWIM zinc finger family protein [Nitrosopumilus sp.]MDH3516930.1 SWIM zinc finger family protein [Nitrosopumilus sp.]MDH3565305.1 SWIM zinc finger family protein [Nitrosopumilus sp.]MDH5416639.1 SWIM zinc finger family protein [Nitrosopumilus sp.]
MTQDLGRIQSIVSEKRVKLHVFEPSQRKIWTVVGVGDEYWLDPDDHYCSCPGFYFGQLAGKITCYHLESAELARKENQVDKIIFSDEEFSDFLSGLISDL